MVVAVVSLLQLLVMLQLFHFATLKLQQAYQVQQCNSATHTYRGFTCDETPFYPDTRHLYGGLE